MRRAYTRTVVSVLTKDVRQIFYVTDTTKKKRHVVLTGKRRIIGVENIIYEEEFNHVTAQILKIKKIKLLSKEIKKSFAKLNKSLSVYVCLIHIYIYVSMCVICINTYMQ